MQLNPSLFYRPLFLICFLFVIPFGQAQDYSKEAQKRADDLVRAYQAELGMTIEQATDFHKAVADFETERMKVQAKKLPADQEMAALKSITKSEMAAMGNLLKPNQMKAYKKLRKSLQPI